MEKGNMESVGKVLQPRSNFLPWYKSSSYFREFETAAKLYISMLPWNLISITQDSASPFGGMA